MKKTPEQIAKEVQHQVRLAEKDRDERTARRHILRRKLGKHATAIRLQKERVAVKKQETKYARA